MKWKNALESVGNIAEPIECRISNLKVRNLEMIQVEEERELFFLKEINLKRTLRLLQKNQNKINRYTIRIGEGEETRLFI